MDGLLQYRVDGIHRWTVNATYGREGTVIRLHRDRRVQGQGTSPGLRVLLRNVMLAVSDRSLGVAFA